ncbi:hypothetical protein DNTS_025900 [Danionella cerebrum]|uniref:AKNA domain-containing protein n=1 Tax=Danionella cerebrum TaxID=2873325 RepID=A0A553MWW8_9TELE|nr:hypothetical protein DNTS_025900 [Danionella translucida]
MEQCRGDTTAGLLNWTPAPVLSSPSSQGEADLNWDEELDEDFHSLMDQNGIIGLETGDQENAEELLWEVKTPEPESGLPPTLEEMSLHLSGLLDSEPLSQATGDDFNPRVTKEERVTEDEQSVILEEWTDVEGTGSPEVQEHRFNAFSEKDTVESLINQAYPLAELGTRTRNSKNSHSLKFPEFTDQSDCGALKMTERPFLPASLHPSMHSTELKNGCGIEADTDRELETRPHSASATYQTPVPKISLMVGSNEEQMKCKISPQPSIRTPRDGKTHKFGTRHSPHHNLEPPAASPRKTNPASCDDQVSSPARSSSKANGSPNQRNSPATKHRHFKTSLGEANDIRKGQLNHNLPDFSKVESRVRFPKRKHYTPPKRQQPPSHPNLPVVFQSPAEIVREVLLSSSDGALGQPSSSRTSKSLQGTVPPEEFRCPLQASTLMQQLQEDYNRLLTKYAEAENTIDRLRLQAKVGLYSEPPKPNTSIQSGVMQEGSKVMTLSFPQAQRAEFGPGSLHLALQKELAESSRNPGTPRPSSVSSGSFTADHLTETLSKQTHRFQLQLDAFEILLKNGKLKHCEQIKGLSTLAEGQESLERAYLDARAQCQLLRHVNFDPERDLEGQIFSSGMRLEELKEWLEQAEPKPAAFSPFSPSETPSASVLEMEPMPESPLSAVAPETCVRVEVSSVSEESDTDNEDHQMPFLSQPPQHQCVEKVFGEVMDCGQMLEHIVALNSQDLLEFRHSSPTGNNNAEQKPLEVDNEMRTIKPAQWQPVAEGIPPFCPSVSSQVCDAMETHPESCCHSSVLPGQLGRGRKTQSRSLINLTQNSRPRPSGLKAKAKTVREPFLDGVASPETDSGFLGSESSQHTPALPSTLQQRTVVSISLRPSDPKNEERPETAAPPPGQPSMTFSSLSEVTLDSPEQTNPVKKRCSYSTLSSSISPLHWRSPTLRPWPSNLTNQSQHESEEEILQNGNSRHPANQQPCSHRSPSHYIPHHGDRVKAQSSVQLTNHQSSERRGKHSKRGVTGENSPEPTWRQRSASVPRRPSEADLRNSYGLNLESKSPVGILANEAAHSTSRGTQPMQSLQRDRGGIKQPLRPPPLLQRAVPVVPYLCNPVTPLTSSQSLWVSGSPIRERSRVRGNHRRSLSMDPEQQSLISSLSRAVAAARHMRQVSQRMAHSLSS